MYIIRVDGDIVPDNKSIIVEKLENVVSIDNMTDDVKRRIEKISKFTDRLEYMDPRLKLEFLKIVDDIILEGNIDSIILNKRK